MVAEQQDVPVGYELALRVIGRHLDAEPAYNISLLEVEDGFTVRYQPALHSSEVRSLHFSKSRLQDLFVFQTAGRGCARKRDRHEGLWAKFVDGHQEFFRALGFVLDQDQACNLSFDELLDEVRISYTRQDPQNPVRSEKRNMALREEDMHAMVEKARGRRGTGLGKG